MKTRNHCENAPPDPLFKFLGETSAAFRSATEASILQGEEEFHRYQTLPTGFNPLDTAVICWNTRLFELLNLQ